MQHKWHKEIKAWADGVEIEMFYRQYDGWSVIKNPTWLDDCEYRIKPQQKKETEKDWNRRMAEKALAIPEISEAVDRLFEAFAVKEPQYLFVYKTVNGIEFGTVGMAFIVNSSTDKFECIGKIKLEEENE